MLIKLYISKYISLQVYIYELTMNGRSEIVSKLKSRRVNLADPDEIDVCSDVSILIGIDNYFKFVYGNEIHKDLFSIPSRVGNLIAGTIYSSCSDYLC